MVDSATKHLHPHIANRGEHTLLWPSNERSSSMHPFQVLQGVHAEVEGRGRTEGLAWRRRGRGEIKVLCITGREGGRSGGSEIRRSVTGERCVHPCTYMYVFMRVCVQWNLSIMAL